MMGFVGLIGVSSSMGALPLAVPVLAFMGSLAYKPKHKYDLSHMNLTPERERVMRKFMYDYEQENK